MEGSVGAMRSALERTETTWHNRAYACIALLAPCGNVRMFILRARQRTRAAVEGESSEGHR